MMKSKKLKMLRIVLSFKDQDVALRFKMGNFLLIDAHTIYAECI